MKRIFAISSLLFALSGCSGNPAGIQFDATVPVNQKLQIEEDLRYLVTLQLPTPSTNELSLIGVSDLSPASLVGFLSKRIKYIVGESFVYSKNYVAIQNQSSTPSIQYAESLRGVEASTSEIVMYNLGALLYLQEKSANSLYYLTVSALGSIPIKSPRVGILQVGSGLFTANSIPNVPLNGFANSLVRLSTYFHESRHSDGNGTTTAFPHAECPSGTFAGEDACDMNLNGPYAIQAILLKYFYNACEARGCTAIELKGLETKFDDFASRLIGSNTPDARPEALP